MKILITGGSGALGGELNKVLSKDNQIISIYNFNISNCDSYNSRQINITNNTELENIFKEFHPDAVIHSAAISNPVSADKLNPKVVYDTNVNATKKIAELCEHYSCKMIYTSSDLIYAGYRGTMLAENSKPVPISLYAETKLMGEVKITDTFENYLILRMSLMFGIGKYYRNNHFNKMYNKLKNGETVSLFIDQFRTPISFSEAAKIIAELMKLNLSGNIINLAGKEKISRFEKGEILCEEAGLSKSLLLPKKMIDIKSAYQVKDVSMSTDKLRSYGIKQKSLRDMIRMELNKGV